MLPLKLFFVLILAAGLFVASRAVPGDAAYPLRAALQRLLYLDGGPPLALAPTEASGRYLVGVAIPEVR